MLLEPPLTPPESTLERERGVSVFFSYAHRDKGFRDRLEEHLSNLKYRGLITTWYDREISAGEEWAQQIDIHLNKAQVILLLISASFMASDYCYSIEMRQALERYERHEADVIPILLRPVLYTDAPFAKLQMLPTNGKPIVLWRDRDSAFVDVAYAIERVAQKYLPPARPQSQPPEPSRVAVAPSPPAPKTRRRGLLLIPLGVFGLVACAFSLAYLALLGQPSNSLVPTPTPTPIIILGILLLVVIIVVGVIVALIAIREKTRQRRAQEATEEARKRQYYEEAIAAYRRALAHNPLDADALRGMGTALCALGNYDQALDAFTRAIDCDSTSAAYAGLGNIFAKLKRYTEAVEAYEKAIEQDPTVTLNYDDFTRALQALGRKEEAERIHAMTRQPGSEDQE